MTDPALEDALSRSVWAAKYRYTAPPRSGREPERTIADSWDRVAHAVAGVESSRREAWQREFTALLTGLKFLPAGRILAGAGTAREVTLYNCFVMGHLRDSLDAIFDHLKHSAVTMQWGGGIGVDFSGLRPRGSAAATRGTIASGPVSFMRIWDAMCATLLSTGARRGAMMATLRCDHPDIETFVDAKREAGALVNFNVSVQVSDEFMHAVREDRLWPLCFPADQAYADGPLRQLHWSGSEYPVACRVVREVPARRLWQRIMDAAYDTAEPGVLFVDTINRQNNLWYREHITTTNPCGEIPLPAHGACNLGSLNLTQFVRNPFDRSAAMDFHALAESAALAVRFLDNVTDLSRFPLPEQRAQAHATRRIGLGLTGLGDALIMLGLHYDSDVARHTAVRMLATIRDAAYRQSCALAVEKGPFPALDREACLEAPFIRSLPDSIRDAIARHGIRNSHLLAIAPAGTISVLANNVSSGIEPVFALQGTRRVLDADGKPQPHRSVDYAYALWQRHRIGPLPDCFVTAAELAPRAHLDMLAALQTMVDNAISKTINVPETLPREAFADVYERAWELGLKGCTVFRPNAVRGAVLSGEPAGAHCCARDREAD